MRICSHCHQNKPRPLGELCQFCRRVPAPSTTAVTMSKVRTIVREQRHGIIEGAGVTLPVHEVLPFASIACATVGISLPLVRSLARTVDVASKRALVVYLLRRERGLSYPTIGAALNKNHSTCVWAVQNLEAHDDGIRLAELRAKYKARLEQNFLDRQKREKAEAA